MVKAILYDLDGVLVDACEWHYKALNDALVDVCGFEITPPEHEKLFNGLTTKTKLTMLAMEGRITENQIEPISALKQHYTQVLLDQLNADSVKVDLHTRTKELGIVSVCCTNSIRSSAFLMLSKTGQLPFLDFFLSNEDVRSPKPCGEVYVRAMIRLGLYPDEVLIVEDSATGIVSARSTGARVLEVANAAEVCWDRIKEHL